MTQIQIETIDSKVWHPEHIAVQLTKVLQVGPVTVNLLSEGPCCENSGIDKIISYVCDSFNFDYNMININTSNQIKSSKFKETRTGFVELSHCINFAKKNPYIHKVPNLKFGMFVSRSNWKRLGLASYLWNNYKNTSSLSFHFDRNNDYHLDHFGLEQLLIEEHHNYDVINFIKQLPIKFKQHTYPIQFNNDALDLAEQYQNIFCDIVCETYFTGKTFFVTEKTWRPIIYRRPFIVQGPEGYLDNLKKLGFKTFSNWWPEGYDKDINGGTLNSIRNCIDYIASKSQTTLNQWLEEMQPILDHNYSTLCNLTNQQILSTRFCLNETT
jgi:hypothetical protein